MTPKQRETGKALLKAQLAYRKVSTQYDWDLIAYYTGNMGPPGTPGCPTPEGLKASGHLVQKTQEELTEAANRFEDALNAYDPTEGKKKMKPIQTIPSEHRVICPKCRGSRFECRCGNGMFCGTCGGAGEIPNPLLSELTEARAEITRLLRDLDSRGAPGRDAELAAARGEALAAAADVIAVSKTSLQEARIELVRTQNKLADMVTKLEAVVGK